MVFLAPVLVHPVDSVALRRLFLANTVSACKPEALEQLRYLLAIVVAPLTFVAMYHGSRRWLEGRYGVSGTARQLIVALGLGVQLHFVVQVVLLWYRQQATMTRYFDDRNMRSTSVVVLAASTVGVLLHSWLKHRPRRVHRLSFLFEELLPALLGCACLVSQLSSAVFTDGNLLAASKIVVYHLPFTHEEFAAVLNGRFPLVDFFPQYQNFLSLLMAPFFAHGAFTVTRFSVGMVVLSGLGFLAVFATLRIFIGNAWLALCGFLPFVAASLFAGASPGAQREHVYTYYAVGPLRYVGPWLLVAGTAAMLKRPSRSRQAAVALGAAFCLWNNLDFGLPACVASWAAVVMSNPAVDWRRPSWLFKHTARFAGAALLIAALYSIAAISVTGSWPQWSALTRYARIFALAGFMMMEMPPSGLHLVIYATFMAALFRGYTLRESASEPQDGQQRLRGALLVWSGVFGAGASMYYVGRSHPDVLSALFSAWTFSLSLLALDLVAVWRERVTTRASVEDAAQRSRVSASFLVAPTGVVLWLLLAIASSWADPLLPTNERKRFAIHDSRLQTLQADLSQYVRKHTTPGQAVFIIYPFGYTLARSAGVQNFYPYAHGESLVVQTQVDEVLDILDRHGVRQVFGSMQLELEWALYARGFRRSPELELPADLHNVMRRLLKLRDPYFHSWTKTAAATPLNRKAG